MQIYVKVVPGAKSNRIEKLGAGNLKVWLKSLPEKGQANLEVVELLAEHFHKAKSEVIIKAGHKSRIKQVEINN